MQTTQAEELRLLSRLFTRPVFSGLVQLTDWRMALDFLRPYNILRTGKPQPLHNLFEFAWSKLHRDYRTEYIYKAEIANRIIFGRHRPTTAALQIEMPVGRSIVDAAIFNGTSTAYEVKSEFDSPRRLESQSGDYLKVFDKVYVVTHPQYASSYQTVLDERVGILVLNEKGNLTSIREAEGNRSNVDARTIFRCLRRAEYVQAIEVKKGIKLTYPNGVIADECEAIFSKFTSQEAHIIFTTAMRRRTIDPLTVSFVSQLPKSLRVLGYSTPLSEKQRLKVLDVLNEKISFSLA